MHSVLMISNLFFSPSLHISFLVFLFFFFFLLIRLAKSVSVVERGNVQKDGLAYISKEGDVKQ